MDMGSNLYFPLTGLEGDLTSLNLSVLFCKKKKKKTDSNCYYFLLKLLLTVKEANPSLPFIPVDSVISSILDVPFLFSFC